MNYKRIYDNLIETRKDRVATKDMYTETHHIVPSSMGGTNVSENVIRLTAREHFLAHWLLWRIYRNREMSLAFFGMCKWKSKNHKRYIPSSRVYAEGKEALQFYNKETWKNLSDNEKFLKQSNASHGAWDKMGKEERARRASITSNEGWNRQSSEERNIRAKKAWATRRENGSHHRKKGIVISEQGRKNISEGQKHAKRPPCKEYVCSECGKVGIGSGMFRWHFDNCKKKCNNGSTKIR